MNSQWAPDVIKLDDGSFMMYYSATTKQDTAKHCIGAAKATSVTGPYKPVSNSALICPLAQGGAIDAAAYNDNGQRYLVWKVDGNSIGNGGACGNTGK
jgi:beta-xylosidase